MFDVDVVLFLGDEVGNVFCCSYYMENDVLLSRMMSKMMVFDVDLFAAPRIFLVFGYETAADDAY